MTRWRLILDHQLTGAWNMAADQALFESVESFGGVPTLRLYRWARPTLSFGYASRCCPVDGDACSRLGVDLVRRLTGGRMVLHGADLTYSLVTPFNAPFSGGIRSSCQAIGAVLREGLLAAGIVLDPDTPGRGYADRSVCFAGGLDTELYQGGKKLVGSAQKRGRRGLLQHGSVPLENQYGLLRQILGLNEQSSRWRSIIEQATWANAGTGLTISGERLAEGMVQAFTMFFGGGPCLTGYSQVELARIEELVVHRYATEAWTRGDAR